MNTISEYKIVQHSTAAQLVNSVEKLMREDQWQPLGSHVALTRRLGAYAFQQTMVKYHVKHQVGPM